MADMMEKAPGYGLRLMAVLALAALGGCSALGGAGPGPDALYRPASSPAPAPAAAPATGGTMAMANESAHLLLRLQALETALGGLRNRLETGEQRASAEDQSLSAGLADLRAEFGMLADDVDAMGADLDRLYERVDELELLARKAAEDAAALRLLANAAELRTMGDEGSDIVPEAGQRYALHLASYRDRESARAGWLTLLGRFRDRLQGLEPRLDPLDLGNGESGWLRLIVGPFGDVHPAREACEAVRAAKAYCQVTLFRGTPLG